MVLLVGAGLMMRGFLREQRDLPGFDTTRLLTADILLGGTKYFDKTPQDMNLVTPQCEIFYDQLLERVRALPGVTRAGIISRLPFDVWTHPFTIVGRPAPEPGKEPHGRPQRSRRAGARHARNPAASRTDDPGRGHRLDAVGGRRQQDIRRSPFPGPGSDRPGDPGVDRSRRRRRTIDRAAAASNRRRRRRRGVSQLLRPKSRPPSTSRSGSTSRSTDARTSGCTRARSWPCVPRSIRSRSSVRSRTRSRDVDRDQAAHDFMTMEQRVASSPSVTNSRFFASLFTIFGTLAILLAMVGVYGVMSWVVGQRTTEFGIRMALGARAQRRRRRCCWRSRCSRSLIGVVLGSRGWIRPEPGAQQHVLAHYDRRSARAGRHFRPDARRGAHRRLGAGPPRDPHRSPSGVAAKLTAQS